MLEPKRLKYRRQFRGRMKGQAQRGNRVVFGDYGLKALDRGWVSARQIEAARKAIRGYVKRGGKLWIRVFPDKPITHKPPEVRMGSGKGPVDHFAAVVLPGRILFEIGGINKEMAQEAMRRGAHKLSVATKFVGRDG